MNLAARTKNITAGLVLLVAAFGSSALTLGAARSSVWIGRPLNILVNVQTGPGEDAAALCFDADVSYGDARQNAGGVKVLAEASAQPGSINVRVTSIAVVNEPVVAVELRAGCQIKIARQYVFLADVQNELAAPPSLPTAPIVVASVPASPASMPLPMGRSSGGAARTTVSEVSQNGRASAATASSRERPKPAGVGKTPVVKSAKLGVPAAAVGKEMAGKSRLKIDLADLLAERDPTLRISSQLMSAPSDDLAVRARAADLWNAINMPPELVLRDTERLKSLDKDLQSLRESVAENQKTTAELGAKLQKSEAKRSDKSLIYGLLALLFAAVSAAVYFWYRHREQEKNAAQWWKESVPAPEPGRPPDAGNKRADVALSAAAGPAPAQVDKTQPSKSAGVDINLEMNESMFDSLKNSTLPVNAVIAQIEQQKQALKPIAPSLSERPLKVAGVVSHWAATAEELFDIRQQADFFLSLGQYDHAVEILDACIGEHGESSPLVYLDLLKIFHTLGRKDDYDRYAGDFNRLFTGKLPAFDKFNVMGPGLDAYPELMSRISQLWVSQEVADLIEMFVFRNPAGDADQSFELEAYRELLLLHSVARSILGKAPGSVDTDNAALTHNPFDASKAVTVIGMPFVASRQESELAVDIDLGSLDDQPSSNPAEAGDVNDHFLAKMQLPKLQQESTVDDGVVVTTDSYNLIDFDLSEPAKLP